MSTRIVPNPVNGESTFFKVIMIKFMHVLKLDDPARGLVLVVVMFLILSIDRKGEIVMCSSLPLIISYDVVLTVIVEI